MHFKLRKLSVIFTSEIFEFIAFCKNIYQIYCYLTNNRKTFNFPYLSLLSPFYIVTKELNPI